MLKDSNTSTDRLAPVLLFYCNGTPKNNKFSIVPNGKLIIFRCPKLWGKLQPHYDRLKYWET